MTARDLVHLRLCNQRIFRSGFTSPAEVVSWLGAMQGQDYAGAKWAVGLRAKGVTDADVEGALAERSIVRMWPLRGTLHFVAAEDMRWITPLTAPRIIARFAGRWAQLGLEEATFLKSLDVLARELSGERQLTRAELTATLGAAGISAEGERLSHVLYRAGLEGLVCFGVRRGKEFTYALLDEWVPVSRLMPRDEALAKLARRYFTSRGPATVQDFAWWSGLTLTDARAGLNAVRREFEEVVAEGRGY